MHLYCHKSVLLINTYYCYSITKYTFRQVLRFFCQFIR
nr:MAG TPA: hypothetical protein [Caudoviricetes sp.]